MPLFPSLKSPWVARKSYDSVAEQLGESQESIGILRLELDKANRRIAELLQPAEIVKRQIAEAEDRVKLEELEQTLRKMKESPEPESLGGPPSIDRVKTVAAQARARRIPRKT